MPDDPVATAAASVRVEALPTGRPAVDRPRYRQDVMTMLPVTGGWYCTKCGGTTPMGNVHYCGSSPVLVQPQLNLPQGWQCPVCGVVYAPTVPNCHNDHRPPPHVATGANHG